MPMPALAEVIYDHRGAAVLIGVDRGAARMLLHRDDDGRQPLHGLEFLEILHGPVRVEDHAVDGQLRQAARDVAQAHRPALIELDERHGVLAVARRGDDAVECGDVAGAGDVEHAQADAPVLAPAQGPSGETRVEAELVHGVHDPLARLLDDARLAVDHARDRLAGHPGEPGDICHGDRATAARTRRGGAVAACYRLTHSCGPLSAYICCIAPTVPSSPRRGQPPRRA